jgi:hypothetical protein
MEIKCERSESTIKPQQELNKLSKHTDFQPRSIRLKRVTENGCFQYLNSATATNGLKAITD